MALRARRQGARAGRAAHRRTADETQGHAARWHDTGRHGQAAGASPERPSRRA